jgi:hypothetical protein
MSAHSFSVIRGDITYSGTVAPGQSTVDVDILMDGDTGTAVCTNNGSGILTMSTLPPTPAARAVISPDLLSCLPFHFKSCSLHRPPPCSFHDHRRSSHRFPRRSLLQRRPRLLNSSTALPSLRFRCFGTPQLHQHLRLLLCRERFPILNLYSINCGSKPCGRQQLLFRTSCLMKF